MYLTNWLSNLATNVRRPARRASRRKTSRMESLEKRVVPAITITAPVDDLATPANEALLDAEDAADLLVTGTVTDDTGAAVAGVPVVITATGTVDGVATTVTDTVTTNAAGVFTTLDLDPAALIDISDFDDGTVTITAVDTVENEADTALAELDTLVDAPVLDVDPEDIISTDELEDLDITGTATPLTDVLVGLDTDGDGDPDLEATTVTDALGDFSIPLEDFTDLATDELVDVEDLLSDLADDGVEELGVIAEEVELDSAGEVIDVLSDAATETLEIDLEDPVPDLGDLVDDAVVDNVEDLENALEDVVVDATDEVEFGIDIDEDGDVDFTVPGVVNDDGTVDVDLDGVTGLVDALEDDLDGFDVITTVTDVAGNTTNTTINNITIVNNDNTAGGGNLEVRVRNGKLRFRADRNASINIIVQETPTGLTITGVNGTTINGAATLSISGVDRIRGRFGNGNDRVLVRGDALNSTVYDVRVNGRGGSNVATIDSLFSLSSNSRFRNFSVNFLSLGSSDGDDSGITV